MAADSTQKLSEGRKVSLFGVWLTAEEYIYFKRLAKLREQSISSMGHDLIYAGVRALSDQGTLIPATPEVTDDTD